MMLTCTKQELKDLPLLLQLILVHSLRVVNPAKLLRSPAFHQKLAEVLAVDVEGLGHEPIFAALRARVGQQIDC
eukprot:8334530-Lingulodinium_polyedra.AAC.1